MKDTDKSDSNKINTGKPIDIFQENIEEVIHDKSPNPKDIIAAGNYISKSVISKILSYVFNLIGFFIFTFSMSSMMLNVSNGRRMNSIFDDNPSIIISFLFFILGLIFWIKSHIELYKSGSQFQESYPRISSKKSSFINLGSQLQTNSSEIDNANSGKSLNKKELKITNQKVSDVKDFGFQKIKRNSLMGVEVQYVVSLESKLSSGDVILKSKKTKNINIFSSMDCNNIIANGESDDYFMIIS